MPQNERTYKLPSSTRAVAMRSFGRQSQKLLFIVVMISLYCSVVSAFGFMFIGTSSEKFVIRIKGRDEQKAV